ncbi:MAG: hypothetical protein FWC64_09875, partial [Treponema sp.]|nr:hypothetical protein [Treponema sp.]
MKKAILLFSLLSVLAGGAFAQVSFSGSVYAGVRLHIPYDGDESITTNHRDYDDPQFNLTATVMRENYGARLVTRTRMLDGEGDFAVRGAYGWVNFAGPFGDDSLRLTVGQISSPAWVTRLHS